MPLKECIRRRLLIAAEQSYSSPLPTLNRFADIGWAAPPRIVRMEPDVAVVGRWKEGAVVLFRGTRPPFNPRDDAMVATFLDWLNDADCALVKRPSYPGRVHKGFARSTDLLWPAIYDEVRRQLSQAGTGRLLIAGHSKGGALANLAGWRAAATLDNVAIRVVTFAGARPGDEAFKQAYEANAEITTTRYTVQFDPVPDLPPGPGMDPRLAAFLRSPVLKRFGVDRISSYFPVGEEIKDSPTWRASLAAWAGTAAGALRNFSGTASLLSPFINAHRIEPGYAYSRLICGNGCAHD